MPDIRGLLDTFYDGDGSPASFVVMIGPLIEYFRGRERARRIVLVCSENDIGFMKVFPDGEMNEL